MTRWVSQKSGPDGTHPAAALSGSLEKLGIPLRRFKTGTPARVHRDSIDCTRTKWPLAVPPMEGLQGMLATASREMVKRMTGAK